MHYDEYVYLIRHPDGYYKIGLSNNPARRKQTLEQATPYSLEIEYLISTPQSESVENILHDAFKHKHQQGEWYEIPSVIVLERVKNILSQGETPEYQIHTKNHHDSLFNPPKKGVIEEGNTLFVSYVSSKGSMIKMANIKNVEFDFNDEFKINKIDIHIEWEGQGSSRIQQERGGVLELKTSMGNCNSLKEMSDEVEIVTFPCISQ